MNFIRQLLPGGKHRMMDENKSLDIAAITPRMYAMSYPSESFFESMYHNDQDDIADFLNKNHPQKYLIFNLSGIPYTSNEKFNNSVINYFWPDHKAPPLYDIFKIIHQAYSYLTKDIQNVICVHCLAGKGRTGTICCSLLLYGKLCFNAKDSNDYFSLKRFKKLNKGVQEPSQLRYINYIDKLIHDRQYIQLKMYEIMDVYISGINLKDGEKITYKYETNYYKGDVAYNYLSWRKGQIVTGDVTINIYRNDKLFAWVFFNTHVENNISNNKLYYNIKSIDPRTLLKESDYSLMTVEINIFPYVPNNQNGKLNLSLDGMIKEELSKINEMNKYLDYAHKKNQTSFINENTILFFGKEKNNIYDFLNENNPNKQPFSLNYI